MAITYSEFDTTPANLISALKSAILANPAWASVDVTPVQTTLTSSTSTGSAFLALASTTGLTPGQWLTINPGTGEVYRQIDQVTSATQVTIVGTMGVAISSGAVVRTRNTILKATTDRGADMIIDLEAGYTSTNALALSAYRQWTAGSAPQGMPDADTYMVYYKSAAGTTTMPVHVVLSVSKNHLFVSLEGPRANEPSTTSTTYGSVRNYFAMSDLVPYHAADTIPAVVAIGGSSVSPNVSNNTHRVGISRDAANTVNWQSGRLTSLIFPTAIQSDTVTGNRSCSIDGKTYLLPYVLFSNVEGIRGRLKHFFFAGTNIPSYVTDYPEPVGSKIAYDGVVYKLLAVNKGDNSYGAWGPFGSASNNSAGTIMRSVVVAVPFADAV